MKLSKIFIFISVIFLYTGCTSKSIINDTPTQALKLSTTYDYQLLNNKYEYISIDESVNILKTSDVIFIGEYHGNHASHLLQLQLLHKLFQLNTKPIILSMEMFTRDQQIILNNYLNSEIGERYLIDKAPSWGNYKGSYRPLIEYAKENSIPVIASNANQDIIRCIGHKGADYITKLNKEEKFYIAQKPFKKIPGYEEKFFSYMSKSQDTPTARQQQKFLGQLARDNTMAESISNTLKESPNFQVIHLNGSFHSENHLGTVKALKILNPDLDIMVITPIHLEDYVEFLKNKKNNLRKDDIYYLLNPQPKQYIDTKYRMKKLKEKFAKSKEKAKSCK